MRPFLHATMTSTLVATLVCAGGAPLAAQSSTPAPRWVATWASAAQLTEDRNMPPAPGLTGSTLRQALRVSIGGSRLRVHFSNQYGKTPLEIRSAHIAVYRGEGAIDPATDRALAFDGKPGVTIAPGRTVVSDPLDYDLAPMADVAITTALGAVPPELTGHPGSRITVYFRPGDEVSAPTLADGAHTDHWYVMTSIDVVAPEPAAAVAILGNSITDGRGSTTNGNDRWPDMLSRRLRANPATRQVAVLNQGVGGNCVLRPCLGEGGVARFPRDLLDQPGVRWAIVFEGVNDINGVRGAAAWDSVAHALIRAYELMIAQAHVSRVRIYGATITPFGRPGGGDPAREAARATVNEWIRTSGAFDGVIDFDAAIRDPANPTQMLPDADSGDHLHPSAVGYRMMGDAIDLTFFSTP